MAAKSGIKETIPSSMSRMADGVISVAARKPATDASQTAIKVNEGGKLNDSTPIIKHQSPETTTRMAEGNAAGLSVLHKTETRPIHAEVTPRRI